MAVRVLQVVTYMGRGGLETMLMNYYRNIDRSKIQFDFLVHRDFEADYDKEILSMGGKIHRISRLIPWSSAYRNELKKFFDLHPEYRIVHVHQDCLSAVALQCAKECGVPVRIAHSHNCNQDKNIKYLIKRYYMKQIPVYATDLCACGQAAGTWMFSGRPFTVIPNAIDSKQYIYNTVVSQQIRSEFGLGNEPVVGHVGRFHQQKNHAFLLWVFSEYLKFQPQAKLLLVGDGEGKEKIQKQARMLGIQNNIIFTGIRSDVPRLMQAMDVFVFPSRYEGLPVTLIEAQAAGLPCVISDTISDECIFNNKLVASKKLTDSSVEWAKNILTQMEQSKQNHATEVIAAGYDIEAAAKQLEKFYLQRHKE